MQQWLYRVPIYGWRTFESDRGRCNGVEIIARDLAEGQVSHLDGNQRSTQLAFFLYFVGVGNEMRWSPNPASVDLVVSLAYCTAVSKGTITCLLHTSIVLSLRAHSSLLLAIRLRGKGRFTRTDLSVSAL